jgi:rhodanese-related sulfurtransferase
MNFATQTDYRSLIKNGAIVVDVRTKDEYASGHVQGSLNIPLDTIDMRIADLKAMHKPVIAVCRSGARSSVAASVLHGAGIEVYNAGGWTDLDRVIR